VPLAGSTAIMNVYEDSCPGPTLRVRPGDMLRVNLVNTLDDLPPGLPDTSPFLCAPMDMGGVEMGGMCDTNIHVHG
jgi:FtsP/CotA-like multicopper oxidase with cupredoxin domain